MGHQCIFQVKRTNPLSSRLDQVFCAIRDFQVSVLVEHTDVAGPKPAVIGPLILFFRQVVIARGHPCTAQLDFAHGLAVPRHLTVLAHDPELGQRRGNARHGCDCILLLVGPTLHICLELIGSGFRTALRQPPALDQSDAVLVQLANQRHWRRSPADQNSHRQQLPASRVLFQVFNDVQPNCWNAGRDRHILGFHEFQQTLRIQMRPRKNQLATRQCGGKGQTPSVDVKHRDDGQEDVVVADSEVVCGGLDQRVQHDRTMGEDDALRPACCPGGVAHGSRFVFLQVGIVKLPGACADKFLIILETRPHRLCRQRNYYDPLKLG